MSVLEQEGDFDPKQVFKYSFEDVRIPKTVSEKVQTMFRFLEVEGSLEQ